MMPQDRNQPSNGERQSPAPTSQPYQPYNQTQGPAPQPQYSSYNQPQPGPVKPPKRPKNPLLVWGGVVGGLVALVLVTILVIIPLFNRSTRTEADPFAASSGSVAMAATAPATTAPAVVSTTSAAVTTAAATTNAATATNAPATTAAAEKPAVGANPGGGSAAGAAATTIAATTAAASTATTAPAKGTAGAQIIGKGEFNRIDAIHYARGTATIGVTGDGKKVLRFDNFTSNQGPDLKVYLGTRADGSKVKEGGLNLGALPATDGSYNINIPDNADLSKYKSVVIWCEAFSVTFSVASLS